MHESKHNDQVIKSRERIIVLKDGVVISQHRREHKAIMAAIRSGGWACWHNSAGHLVACSS